MGNAAQHEQIYKLAIEYVRLGLPIIPLCPHNHANMSYSHRVVCQCAGKAPIMERWPTHSYTSEEDIAEWFDKNKFINIGLPLGKATLLVGIDVDGEHGEELLKTLSKGDLPPTWEFTTGNGRRLLYKLPPGVQTKKFRQSKHDKEHQELAILCDGQQTVLPPSIHVSGKIYKWKEEHSPFDIDIATAPSWILKQIIVNENSNLTDINEEEQELESPSDNIPDPPAFVPETETTDSLDDAGGLDEQEGKSKGGKKSPTVTPQDWTAKIPEGQRNNHLTKLAGSLLSRRTIPKEEVFLFLNAWNQEHCDPPLPEQELRRMIDTLAASEAMKSAKRTKQKQDKLTFRPTPLAQMFINLQKDLGYSWKYATDQGAFYRCDDSTGPWQRLDNVLVQKAIREVITDESKGGSKTWDTTHYVKEVVDALKELLATTLQDGAFDIGQNSGLYQDIICVENGILYWRTGNLKPWDSNYLTTIQLPVKWDENVECPEWEKALEEWLPDKETRRFIQEYVGLCLIPDTSFRTAVFLYGSGANGKSIFLEGVKMLFGNALVSIPLHRLADRFEVANLQNKLVNICGDIDARYLADTGMLKALISGDTLRGEFKHGKSFDFIPVCRLMFSANVLPRVGDKTAAWYSRWKFIEFPRTFPVNASYKIHLLEAFEKEKSGILRWAVEGLRRLKECNTFTTSQTMEIAAKSYREANDSVAAFISQCLVKSDDEKAYATAAAIHMLYRDWCDQNGCKPVSQIEFSKRAQQLGLGKGRKCIKGKTYMCYLGFRIHEDWEDTFKMYESIRR